LAAGSCVKLRDLSWGQSYGASGGALVGETARLIGGGGIGLGDNLIFSLTGSFVVAEEEQLVFNDGTAERAAEDVADELGRGVGKAAVQFGLFHEPVIGDGDGGAIELVH